MVDLDILIRAQQENERLRLGLSMDQIIAALAKRESQLGQSRAQHGRPKLYNDPTAELACGHVDKERGHGRAT